MTQTEPLITYLAQHGIIDPELEERLRSQGDRAMLTEALVHSGLMNYDELNHIESLLSGYPMTNKRELKAVDGVTFSEIPFEVAHRDRVVCVGEENEVVCVLTDQNTLNEEELQRFAKNRKYRIEKTTTEHLDRLLEKYQNTTQKELISSIERSATRVRDIERYGSSSMAMFFPEDHKREIAEDLSNKKLLKSLVTLGYVKKAERIVLESHADKVLVLFIIEGVHHTIMSLPKRVENPLMLTLQYLCDVPLGECEKPVLMKTKLLTGSHNQQTLEISVTPTYVGYHTEILLDESDELFAACKELGLSTKDSETLYELYRKKKGSIVITGRPQNGKSFVYYQLLEAVRNKGIVFSIESDIEYVIDGVNQVPWSKMPAHDITHACKHADTVGLRPTPMNNLLALVNQSNDTLIVTETEEGVIGLVKSLLKQGVHIDEVMRFCNWNMVTIAFENISQYKKNTTLPADSIATLEQYVSHKEMMYILREEGLIEKDIQINSIQWAVSSATPNLWHKIIRGVATALETKGEPVYIRALVDTRDVLEKSHRRGDSLVVLERELKERQKRALVKVLIPRAYRGEISIADVITMLRA